MDRKEVCGAVPENLGRVALRKESVDRKDVIRPAIDVFLAVALRKESVDRKASALLVYLALIRSLSARRAWIENTQRRDFKALGLRRSPQGERG